MEKTQKILTIPCSNVDDAIAKMKKFAVNKERVIYRGQPSEGHRLSSSFAREYDQSRYDIIQYKFIELINTYRISLIRAGITPFVSENILDWMEYGRHYGLPTPSIDFSYSPYIGLFFAFDTLRRADIYKNDNRVAIYALDLQRLAEIISSAPIFGLGEENQNPWWLPVLAEYPEILTNPRFVDENEVVQRHQSFLNPPLEKFEKTIAKNILQIIPFPGQQVKRIIAQQGLLLYDTLHYKKGKDFEHLLEAFPLNEEEPVVTKFTLPAIQAAHAWELLAQMGITPSAMYLDATAATRDAQQKYFFNSNLSYLRDLKGFEALDDF